MNQWRSFQTISFPKETLGTSDEMPRHVSTLAVLLLSSLYWVQQKIEQRKHGTSIKKKNPQNKK